MLVTDQFQTVKHTLKQLHTLHFEKGLTGKLNQWIHIEHMDLIGMLLIYVISLINITIYFINTKSDNNYQFIPYKFIKEQCFFYQADIWQYLLVSLQQHSVIFYVNTDQTSNPSNFTHQQIKTITTLLHPSIKEQLISFIQVNAKDLHKEDALLLICQVYMELSKIKENENSAIDSSHSELIDRWMNQKIKDIQSQKELTQLNNLRDQQIQHYQENELNQHITQLIEQRTPL